MKKVEQIHNKKVILDYDEKYTSKEIEKILKQTFNITSRDNSEFKINLEGKDLTFLIKNITYLGHPHPIYTKRIQLSDGWEKKLKDKNTFLLGIYNYKKTKLFVYFDKKNFIKRKLNNSSAHVWTNDLLKGYEDGLFQKIDKNKNEIFVIREDFIHNFVKEKFVNKNKVETEEIELFENFKKSLKKKWSGEKCYKEMIKAEYHNKFQPEWAGFYFEFKFEQYLDSNKEYQKICKFIKDKMKGSTDLDIKFSKGFYGDLKTHSNSSRGILGNDYKTIFNSLKKDGKVWYVVLSHDTIKDKDKKYKVTKYWNKKQNKNDLMSYGQRMKYSVELEHFQILEINNYNKKYLSIFKQGINSNGKAREQKIKINKKAINNFLIYECEI